MKNTNELLSLLKLERKTKTSGFKQFSWQLAGFITICDWIASGDDAFTYCASEMVLSDYFNKSCCKAEGAIERAGIIPAKLALQQGLGHLFPAFADTPTPLQKYCDTVEITNVPQLWILEESTGAGKTEAALTLVSRILNAGGGTGCFVALPTMATSNAMYERMIAVYSRIYDDHCRPSLTLSHGANYLSEEFSSSYRDSLNSFIYNYGEGNSNDTNEGVAHCMAWLADSSKKSLLSDVGVGTVDQLLLAGLPVRYQSLRAFGMAQKVLIIDEVHAYDPYMLRLLENIISAQASFGGSVILLSATLPFRIREKFCNSFVKNISDRNIMLEHDDKFPLVTSVTAQNTNEVYVDTRSSVVRKVEVKLCDDVKVIYNLIEEKANEGKCICWIRNTIKDVTEAFEYLQAKKIKDLDMFHSRFTLNDRLVIEKRVLKRFGKASTCKERAGQVLIASQVVEQSLDLDFDVMVSDLAPVDLLIQRAGRLHRHQREERGAPKFYIYVPEDTTSPDNNWYANTFPAAQWVYKDVGLLWRTKEILKDRGFINMPDEARLLIESVYGDNSMQTPAVFENSENEALAEKMNQNSFADFKMLKFEQGYSRMSNEAGGWESEEKASTRLSDRQISFIFVIGMAKKLLLFM